MEKKEFKKIDFGNPPLPLEELEAVAGGQQNIDPETGQFDTNLDHMDNWYNKVVNYFWYKRCPQCGNYWGTSMNKYSSDQWWYCFWYNRLYCGGCKEWKDELY